MTSNVKCVRLSTGEDLIGEIEHTKEGMFKIKNPLMILLQPSQTGGLSLRLIPHLMYAKSKEFTYPESSVIMDPFDATDELEKEYRAAFSKIVLPESKLAI